MAYDFTAASSQFLSVASAPATVAPLTMACWFNSKTSQVGSLLTLSNTNTRNGFILYKNASNNLFALSVVPTNSAQASISGIVNNSWQHGAAVFPANNSRVAYLNGNAGTTNTTTINPSGLNSVYIAADINPPNVVAYANTLIAEVGVWNVALTADEIASLAKGMTCDKVRPQNLVFYAPLVRNLQDAKGGLTITNNGGATVTTHPRVYA